MEQELANSNVIITLSRTILHFLAVKFETFLTFRILYDVYKNQKTAG